MRVEVGVPSDKAHIKMQISEQLGLDYSDPLVDQLYDGIFDNLTIDINILEDDRIITTVRAK